MNYFSKSKRISHVSGLLPFYIFLFTCQVAKQMHFNNPFNSLMHDNIIRSCIENRPQRTVHILLLLLYHTWASYNVKLCLWNTAIDGRTSLFSNIQLENPPLVNFFLFCRRENLLKEFWRLNLNKGITDFFSFTLYIVLLYLEFKLSQ